MNIPNILAVAAAIEAAAQPDATPELGFNMRYWRESGEYGGPDLTGHGCDTVACIGGWTEHLFKGECAYDSLDVSPPIGIALFLGTMTATPAQAVACLRNLAATGVVDWPKAMTS